MRAPLTAAARCAPPAAVAAGATAIAWFDHGSVAPAQFLPWAVFTALLVCVLALAGSAVPTRAAAAATGGLLALAAWAAVSGFWAPIPSAARDQALLVSFGALALLVPSLTIRTAEERLLATGLVTAAITLVAAAALYHLRSSYAVEAEYADRRLGFPIAYSNAQAALLALGFWPAVVLGARRSSPVLLRSAALGAAALCGGEILMAQSKGAVIGLAVAAVAVTAVSPARLRALLAGAVALAPVAVAAVPLTAPFRTSTIPERVSAVHHAALVAAIVAVGGVVAGAVYAALDRRVELAAGTRTRVGRVVALAALVLAAAGLAVAAVTVTHPLRTAGSEWRSFKHSPGRDTASTHLFTLGSNRYDFWVVAAHEWRAHPLLGAGSGAFAVDYLQKGHSYETPARPHSLPLELLGELGLAGFLLGLFAFGAILVSLARKVRRRRGPALAAFAAATGFLAQACVDWTWTFPAVTVPLFVLCGIGLSGGPGLDLTPRISRPIAAAAALGAAIWFLPPWLSTRLVDRGTTTGSRSDLRWAARLDPISTAPLLAQARTAATPQAALPPLERAVHREPRSIAVRFILGSTLFNAHRLDEAEAQFKAALALHPGDAAVVHALTVVRSARP